MAGFHHTVGGRYAGIPSGDLLSPNPYSPTETHVQEHPLHLQTDTISQKTDTVSHIFSHFHVGDS